jgi:hypothetical protein
VQVARLGDPLGEDLERRSRPRIGAELLDCLVVLELIGRQQLRPGSLLGAELAQAQLAPVRDPDEQARGSVAQRGASVPELKAARGHQVDQEREVAGLDDQHLPRPPDTRDLAARKRI